jgi:hypothetical protein
MERYGHVHQIEGGPVGMRKSYRYGLLLPDHLGWPDEDVVSFVEDDYLFTEDAFVALDDAARQLPQASYFTLHGRRPMTDDIAERNEFGLPDAWRPQPDYRIGDRLWLNVASTTSTFGARVGPLRQDLPIFWQCMIPFRNRYLDHETSLIYQGNVPYRGIDLLTGLPGDFVPSLRGVARTLFLVPFRVALNIRGRRQKEAHYLYALSPNATTHLEEGVISPDQDWPVEADKVATWADEQSLTTASTTIRRVLSRAN